MAAAARSAGPALIDDGTPTPAHARFSWRRLGRVVAVCLCLWIAAIGALALAFGADAVLSRMAWFFTKAALLTFGGAYAVLPYVYQGAVEHHQWLTGPQMIDGLALGETTPGPLIMVVAFVGFVGGWARQVLGPEALFLGGALAATVVTYFTFLPSFLFILAGGPLVESTHGKLGFTAPLAAITAAVVGVILNLALFFAWHEGALYLASEVKALFAAGVPARWHREGLFNASVMGGAPTETLFRRPEHPYTKALLASVLTPEPGLGVPDVGLGDTLPDPANIPPGCRFHPRCPIAEPRCSVETPPLKPRPAGGVECLLV